MKVRSNDLYAKFRSKGVNFFRYIHSICRKIFPPLDRNLAAQPSDHTFKTPSKLWKDSCREKWVAPTQLTQWAAQQRASGHTIVTLNGSFDLMHAGHLQMVYEASQQGDILIVLLNSDTSIQQYKSPDRPIIPLESRLQMLSALEWVDYVSWFDETDPRTILSYIQPHVHANGAEYGTHCIEAEIIRQQGGRLHLVQRIPGLATTQIIEKIVATCASSAR